MTTLTFGPSTSGSQHAILIGEKDAVLALASNTTQVKNWNLTIPVHASQPIAAGQTDRVQFWSTSQDASSATSHHSVTLATITSEKGRNTSVLRADVLAESVAKCVPKSATNLVIYLACTEWDQVRPAAIAIARAFPLYSKKSPSQDLPAQQQQQVQVRVEVWCMDGSHVQIKYQELQLWADATRMCAKYVDMPTSELNTDTYLREIKVVVDDCPGAKLEVIRGLDLKNRGFGGLWGVGKAAVYPPALAILSYTPNGSKKTIALVGKGIMYDTGGLSLKDKVNMCTMKADMGGSAAILSAFQVLVKTGYPNTVYALLCLAENSMDAHSTRPDDILTMYSGKTVEINNTDAEGRLVLSDGVSYATKHLKPDVVIDMATLTGTQLIATGQRHAAILSNDTALERAAFDAGQKSGEWTYPLLYAPELLKKEFSSDVADMKNSVKNRANAQSSCAGHFIEDHLAEGWKGKWLHVDIAGPALKDGRATGYGPALLVQLLNDLK